jgi:dTDP-D-glucose 4,6-dehydratase
VVHVRDICRAFLAVLDAPPAEWSGRAFNVGATAENYQIRDLAAIVAEVVPGCVVELAAGASPDARDYRVDCSLFAHTFGFEPQWDARRGARELAAAYIAQALTLEDAEGKRYQRIAQLRARLAAGTLTPDLRPTHPAATVSQTPEVEPGSAREELSPDGR